MLEQKATIEDTLQNMELLTPYVNSKWTFQLKEKHRFKAGSEFSNG